MGYVRRKATTQAKMPVEDSEEVKNYLLDIQGVISTDKILVEIVVNFDQTIHYVRLDNG